VHAKPDDGDHVLGPRRDPRAGRLDMAGTDTQRWARGLPHLLWKRPGLPRDWVRVLERHPEGVQSLPGHLLPMVAELAS
jgi:hypothetical protein